MATPQSTLPRPDQDSGQDEKYNPNTQARELYKQELTPGELAAQDQKEAADREATGGGISPLNGGLYAASPGGKRTISGKGKRKGGPLAIILTILGIGGGLGLGSIAGGGVFFQMSNVFTTAFDKSSLSLRLNTNKALQQKINGVRNAFDQTSEGKCNVACRLGTVNESMRNNLLSPNNGFKAEFGDRKFGGRYTIKSVTFPDGTVVSSRAEFDAAMSDRAKARLFNQAFNNRIKFFLNGSRFGLSLQSKFGINRLAKVSGTTEKEVHSSLRAATGAPLPDADGNIDDTSKNNRKDRINKSLSGKASRGAGKVTNVAGTGCLVYDVGRLGLSVAELEKAATFAAFALVFLSQKDLIMSGQADATVISTLGAQLLDNGNGAATDSALYKRAAFGDTVASSSRFSIKPTGALTDVMSRFFTGTNGFSKGALHTSCSTSENPAVTVAICAAQSVPGLAAAGIGAVISFAICNVTNFAAGFFIGQIISALIPAVVDVIVDSDLIIPDETTAGNDAGEVIGLGAQLMLNGKSAVNGLSAATSSDEIVAFENATSDLIAEDRAIARLNARGDQFNPGNPDSFISSFVQKLNISSFGGSSFSGSSFYNASSSMLAIFPRSLSLIGQSAFAETYPLGYSEAGIYTKDGCEKLSSIGVLADSNCVETYVSTPEELGADINVVLGWMISNNQINPNTGAAISGSTYAKYIAHCGKGRVDPLGQSSMSIADPDYLWGDGSNCQGRGTDMTNIRVFDQRMAIEDMLDGFPKSESANATAVLPVDDDYVVTSDFGLREKPCPTCPANHAGIDFSNFPGGSSGRPVYSVLPGTVTEAGRGNNTFVSIAHDDGAVAQYLHMELGDILVKVGDVVTKGQRIGSIGNAGDSTGPHLDFRVYIDGVDLSQHKEIEAALTSPDDWMANSGLKYLRPTKYLSIYGVEIRL